MHPFNYNQVHPEHTRKIEALERQNLISAKNGNEELSVQCKALILSDMMCNMTANLSERIPLQKHDVLVCAAKAWIENDGELMKFETSYFFQMQMHVSKIQELWDTPEGLAMYFQRTDRKEKRLALLKKHGIETDIATKYLNFLMQIK